MSAAVASRFGEAEAGGVSLDGDVRGSMCGSISRILERLGGSDLRL
jgi:hypothetical protein|tara:strand:- start:112 stop:249 length:138 start_codon:yes stop_codon:yes gene_type:complete